MAKQSAILSEQTLFDVSEQQSAQNWTDLEIIQLSTGVFKGQLREMQVHNTRVCFEQQNCMVHKRGIMAEPYCTVSFARSLKAKLRLSEHHSHENSLFFIPSNSEIDIQVAADVETVYFRLEQAQFLERARAVSPEYWEVEPSDALIFDTPFRKSLECYVNDLYSSSLYGAYTEGSTSHQLPDSLIMDKLLLALDAQSINHDVQLDLNARCRARKRVSKALSYIDEVMESGVCPSIVDICVALNISQSNLQYSFKRILGFTPNVYLYNLRLNRARAQLKSLDAKPLTVTQVAMNWQFWHLGRFANDYQRLFGELPSTTLQNTINQ
jgi:AraC family ethanolamine operon transcriptional activator